MKMVLMWTPSNGKYVVLTGNLCIQARLSVVGLGCIQLSCYRRAWLNIHFLAETEQA